MTTIVITSPAFSEGGAIPKKYTCDGEDVSPPLAWSGAPPSAKSLLLIVDDPDAPIGDWVHWVLYEIPPSLASLPEGVATTPNVDRIGSQGLNDFRKTGYGGPCPPKGSTHRYFFKLYALSSHMNIKPGASKASIEKAIEGLIMARGQLMGTYKR